MEKQKTAAIYVRKSVATDKGDSIENQIKRCQALCELRDWKYEVYEDYDISGATLNRPAFENMMKDVYSGKFAYIICYKLDRVSRSTGDFSNLIEELNAIDVGFISIKENFDLTTPTGRAMMLMTSVFAQLERETIAERVRDNMHDRAKLGRWNGGPVPIGFDREVIIEDGNRDKKVSKLVINQNETATIKKIFDYYLEYEGSIRNTVKKLNDNNIYTKAGKRWRSNQINRILQNPLYCIADDYAYDYFCNNTKVNIVDSKDNYNSQHGLMYYGVHKFIIDKDKKKKKIKKPEDTWLLCIGEHKGIIPGKIFAAAQKKLKSNYIYAPRHGQSEKSYLSGLVECGRCGSSMSIFTIPSTNRHLSYFRCLVKEQQSNLDCFNKNIRADKLDTLVLNTIKTFVNNDKLAAEMLDSAAEDIEELRLPLLAKRNELQNRLEAIDNEVEALVDSLAKKILPEYIIQNKFKELNLEKENIYNKLDNISNDLEQNVIDDYEINDIKAALNRFDESFDLLSFSEKKELMHSIIEKVIVTNNIIDIVFKKSIFKSHIIDDSLVVCDRKDMDSY